MPRGWIVFDSLEDANTFNRIIWDRVAAGLWASGLEVLNAAGEPATFEQIVTPGVKTVKGYRKDSKGRGADASSWTTVRYDEGRNKWAIPEPPPQFLVGLTGYTTASPGRFTPKDTDEEPEAEDFVRVKSIRNLWGLLS